MIEEGTIKEEDRWLFLYTLPCTFGRPDVFEKLKETGRFKDFLRENFSRDKVRGYFLGYHNGYSYSRRLSDKKWLEHMLIPYKITRADSQIEIRICKEFSEKYELPNGLKQRRLSKRQKSRMRKYVLNGKGLKVEDILFMHGGFVVDIEENGEH